MIHSIVLLFQLCSEVVTRKCIFIFFTMLFKMPVVTSDKFIITGPDHPILAIIGANATFECLLSPRNISDIMQVQWVKSNVPVHLYMEGSQDEVIQDSFYEGRTVLSRQDLHQGNVSLTLTGLRITDAGFYKCIVKSKDWIDDLLVELQVVALGEAPLISVEDLHEKRIMLLCETEGWFPEPAVIWKNGHQQTLSASTRKEATPDGLYHVSSTLQVGQDSENSYSCFVWNRIMQAGQESRIKITDKALPQLQPWQAAFGVVFAFAAIALPLFILVYRRQLQRFKARERTLKEECKHLLHKLELIKIRSCAVSLTLDPTSSHPYLIVSEDKSSVSYSEKRQDVPDNPMRFDINVCVLTEQGFTSGQHYWEVDVKNKTDWRLGVARDSVNRKGIFTLLPKNGYWLLWLRNGRELKALCSPTISLTMESPPAVIGIYLDYEAGLLSFYNADNMTVLYTFHDTFTDKLYPFFNPSDNLDGTNPDPLQIHPVDIRDKAFTTRIKSL